MKKWVKIGFPIACVVIVGGTLISVSNLKKQAENLPSNNLNVNNSLVSDNTSFESKNKTPIISVNDINTNVNTNTNTNTNTKIDNTSVNKTANNSKNTLKNTVNTTKNNTSINNSSEETDKDLEKKDDKEKAIALASEEWGEDSEVYYTNEGMSSGYYIVAVRDKSNTSVKMFYKVDINNNTVEIDW